MAISSLDRVCAAALVALLIAGCGDSPTEPARSKTPAPTRPTAEADPEPEFLPPLVTPRRLMLEDRVVGTGPAPQEGQWRTIHAVGRLTDGSPILDTRASGKPIRFQPGDGQLVPGLEQGVATMRVGGKRRVVVPPELGYAGRTVGRIPKFSTLIYEVELVAVDE